MKRVMIALAMCIGCHHSSGDPNADKPSSCVIEHDGGVTQCFEDVGATAKKVGQKICDEMHGAHTFRVAQACPSDGVVGSCTKRSGTDLERTERCYRDEAACEARCVKSAGAFKK
jgi:hypothetical protein